MAHGERFTGSVVDGQIRIDQPDRWKALKERLEGKPIEVSVGRLRQNRSLRANNYMWAIYRVIAQETGEDEYRIHAVMKGLYLPLVDLELPNGQTIKTLGTTTTLDTKGFAEFIGKIKAWAAQEGIRVPDPEEVGAL